MDRLDDAWNSSPVSRTPAKFVYISLVSIVSFATVFLHLLKYCWICCKVFSIQMGRSCQLTLQSLHPFPSSSRQQATINIPQIRSHHSCQLAPDLHRLGPLLEVELTQMMGSNPDDASMICRFSSVVASDQVIHSLFPPSRQAIRYEKNGHVASLKAFHVLQ